MGLPAKQRTRTSKKQRASHFAMSKKNLRKCAKCGENKIPHHACTNCGSYRGKKATDPEKRISRKKRTGK